MKSSTHPRIVRLWAYCFTTFVVLAAALRADEPTFTREQIDFFETQVRPILVERCADCHGAEIQESGFRTDARAAMLKGGHSGKPGLVPSKPGESLLVRVVKRIGPVKMPPDEQLAQEDIVALEKWVRMGAPWPGDLDAAGAPQTLAEQLHGARGSVWSLQPVKDPPLSTMAQDHWSQQPLDRFILENLTAHQLQPSDEADQRTLIRRLYFNLLGMPPSPETVDRFVADSSPHAYERLVDRLLASPAYGERWGRHWLDVARYADTMGYAFTRERRYPYAYTYRDYVVQALNQDLPYDQFVTQQLAADQLEDVDSQTLAALGFLTVGRKFNNRHDDIDDQIDVVTRGFLGLTVACARCHDHKYDVIPTDDYYSLYGVFATAKEPSSLPLLGDPEQLPGYAEFKQELDELQAAVDAYQKELHQELISAARNHVTDYLVRATNQKPEKELQKLPYIKLKREALKPKLVLRWRQYLLKRAKPNHAVWGPLFLMIKLPNQGFEDAAAKLVKQLDDLQPGTEPGAVNARVRDALQADPPRSKLDAARVYGQLLSTILAEAEATKSKDDASLAQLREILLGDDSPTNLSYDDVPDLLTRDARNKYRKLQQKVDRHKVESSGAPPRAMVVRDGPPVEPKVFIRGNFARPGKAVPRQFLALLSPDDRRPFEVGGGRLDLARAICDPNNPLTARVIVNRIWMHHMGTPLVDTPSDFGIRSERPVQAKLLDHLAARLVENDWSLKALHREILLSATFRQRSTDRPKARSKDPENRFWWRANRRRLEWEALRDSLLVVSGRIDLTQRGKSIHLAKQPLSRRRTIYAFIDRQDLEPTFRVFDLANPDQSAARRPETTVPQQALFMMNSDFMLTQANALADAAVAAAPQTQSRIEWLYRQVFSRLPTEKEQELGVRFVGMQNQDQASELDRWTQYVQVLLCSNEFAFVD